jgi:3-phenylpropionate/trans-cinnamate dioxygenase ferredoxin reductase subunit
MVERTRDEEAVMAQFQKSYQYVIVGAGVAAAGAVEGIRAVDPTGTIAVLGAEADPPLYRPDLSKTLWLDADASLEDSALDVEGENVELHLRTTVTSIDPQAHEIELADGTRIGFGKLLLATGASPRTTPLEAGERVAYFRTAADYRTLRAVAEKGAHVAVVGGGYIGGEIASALLQNDVEVTLVLPHGTLQPGMFPPALAKKVTDGFAEKGARLVTGRLAGGSAADGSVSLSLEDGTEITADAAVIGIGVTPTTELAEAAGLEVDDGIVVDENLATSAADVFAAGDVASYPDALLGRRRVEHVDNAETMGKTVGRTMAGESTAYEHTPFFWSDLFDDGYEATGELDTSLTVVEDSSEDGGAEVVQYVRDGSVRGVLLWNTWDSVENAQDLIGRTRESPVEDAQSLHGEITPGG